MLQVCYNSLRYVTTVLEASQRIHSIHAVGIPTVRAVQPLNCFNFNIKSAVQASDASSLVISRASNCYALQICTSSRQVHSALNLCACIVCCQLLHKPHRAMVCVIGKSLGYVMAANAAVRCSRSFTDPLSTAAMQSL